MGCAGSKPRSAISKASRPSTRASTISDRSPPRYGIHNTEGHSDVTRPPLAPPKHTLGDILDPDEIPPAEYVRSLSGNLLDAKQFREHPGRLLCVRERQERILQRTQTWHNLGSASPTQIAPFAHEKDPFDFGNTTIIEAPCKKGDRISARSVRTRTRS